MSPSSNNMVISCGRFSNLVFKFLVSSFCEKTVYIICVLCNPLTVKEGTAAPS